MHIRVVGALAVPVLGLLVACAKPEATPLPDAPRIQVFKAEHAELPKGASTRLQYSVTGATSVEVIDPMGQPMAVEGNAENGEVTITPEETSVYVLRAVGVGGRATAFVQVAVGEPLATLFLASVPPEADAGQDVDLAWSAQGAVSVTLSDDLGMSSTLEGTNGVYSFKAEQTRTFTLTAVGSDDVTKTATAQVKVRPRVDTLKLEPGILRAGEPAKFLWEVRGADLLEIEEETFGTIVSVPLTMFNQTSSADWVLPGDLEEGQRLVFTVKVSSATTGTVLTHTFSRHVGLGPKILVFNAPEVATPDRDVTLSWELSGANRVQLFANGLLVYEPRGTDPETLAKGRATLNSPKVSTRFELVVEGEGGAQASLSKVVGVVKPPKISGFNLSGLVNQAGEAAAASWTTEDATQVQIRIKNGPVVYSTRDPLDVANGSAVVYPGTTTTYVLDALNDAGDLVSQERLVAVGAPVNVTVTPAKPMAGQTVTVAWNLPQADLDGVLGVLRPDAVPQMMSGQFVDLSKISEARLVAFANPDDSVAELPAAIAFRFPFAGTVRSHFHVSTNGFVGLDPVDPMPENTEIPIVAGGLGTRQWLPALVAPLWDDLELGSGNVLYHVVGNQFPRRLVIQWDKVQLKGESSSELTFQVQFSETGEVSFVYETLKPGSLPSADASATVGIHGAGFASQYAKDENKLLEKLELQWFNRELGQESFSLKLDKTTRFSFFYRRNSGEVVAVSVPVTVWGSEALSVREAMPLSNAQAGQWVELVNTTTDYMKLDGLRVHVESNDASYVLPEGITLAPGGHFLVGTSSDPNVTGGLIMDAAFEDFTLAAVDTVRVFVDDTEISKLAWTEPTIGESVERDQMVVDSAKFVKSCPRTAKFGTFDELGTPGQPREPCWDYLVEPIAYDPIDILGSGKVEFSTPNGGVYNRLIPMEPRMKLFGELYDTAQFETYGFVAFVPHTKSSNTYSNARAPEISAPNATAVIYGTSWWFETLASFVRPDQAAVWRRFAPGELGPNSRGQWVFAWNRMANLSDKAADVTMQMRLFDDGVIEYHYGMLLNGTSKEKQYGMGEGGPTWLENPTGTEALIINNATRDAPGLRSFSAYRFTPVQ